MNTRWRKIIKLNTKNPNFKFGDLSVIYDANDHHDYVDLLVWDRSNDKYRKTTIIKFDHQNKNSKRVAYQRQKIKNALEKQC